MTFGQPHLLWILPVTVLLLAGFLYWAWRRRQRDILLFVRSRLLAELTVGLSSLRRKIRLGLLVLGVASVLFALAYPRWGVTVEEVKQSGLDILVAIDTSRSMTASDIAPYRLSRAKLAALELMSLAKRDRLGVVGFAGTAFLQCPLTLDEEAFRQSVDALDPGIIPQGGTALGEAIEVARKTLTDEDQIGKVLVLITDGEDHEEGAVEAAKKAAAEGIRLFTIGVGTAEGDMLHQDDPDQPFFKDEAGNVVKSRLNEPLLRRIAEAGKGFYLPLRGPKVMDTLYERGLAPLFGLASGGLAENKSKDTPRMLKHYSERFQWFLGLALLALIAEMFLPERRAVQRRDKSIAASGSPQLGSLATALALLMLASSVQASSSSALRSYQDGHYQSSWLEYKRMLEKHPDDPRLAYNAGAAAYQAKRYEDALALFNEALKSPDLKLQESAYYNSGNALYRSGQQTDEPAQKQTAWENAVQNYESALKLNPKDEDAQYNRDLVKKKLEELKQQDNKKDQDKKDQDKKDQDKKDQDKKDQDKKDQDKKDQDKKDQDKKDQDKKDQDKKDQDKKDQDKKDQDKKDQDKKDQDKKDQDRKDQDKNQSDSKPSDSPDQSQKGQPDQKQGQKPEEKPAADQNQEPKTEPEDQKPPMPEESQRKPEKKDGDDTPRPAAGTKGDQSRPPGEAANATTLPVGVMSKQQAERLLDALKHEEKALIFRPEGQPKNRNRSYKDW